MSKDYENLMDSLTNTPYLDTPLEYFKILDDDVPEGSLRQQLAGGGVVTRQEVNKGGIVSRQNFATKAIPNKPEAGSWQDMFTKIIEGWNTELSNAVKNKDLSLMSEDNFNQYANKKLWEDFKIELSPFDVNQRYGSLLSNKKIETANNISEARVKLAKEIIDNANNNLQYMSNSDLGKLLGKNYEAKSVHGLIKSNNLPKLETYETKVNKAFHELFLKSDPESVLASDLFNPGQKIQELVKGDKYTGSRSYASVASALNKNETFKDMESIYRKLGNYAFKNKISGDDKPWTLSDVITADETGSFLKKPNDIYEKTMYLAQRHAQQAKGNSVVKFYENFDGKLRPVQNLNIIDNYDDVYFKMDGKLYGLNDNVPNAINLKKEIGNLPEFKEFLGVEKARSNLMDRTMWPDGSQIVDPKTGNPTTFEKYSKDLYYYGRGKKGYAIKLPYDVDHYLGISKHPFKNLRIIPSRINVAAHQAKKISEDMVNKIGYNFEADLPLNKQVDNLLMREKSLGEKVLLFDKEGNHVGRKLDTAIQAANKQFDLREKTTNVLQDKLNLSKTEANEIDKTVKTLSDKYDIKFNSWSGFDVPTFEKIYNGLKRTSRALKLAKFKEGAGYIIPLSIADIALNIPIVAMDYIQGVPAAESVGTVLMQDLSKEYLGVAIPGTTEEQFYEKFKEAEPAYKLREKLQDWQSTAELYTPLSVDEDGKRTGVFLEKRFTTYPELARRGRKSTESAEKDYYDLKEEFKNMPEEDQKRAFLALARADEEREKIKETNKQKRFEPSKDKSEPIGVYGNQIETGQVTGNIPQYYKTGGRVGYQEAGLVEKLGRGAQALDPRNVPYYAAKGLKGLGSGVEMAVKFPAAAGAAIGESLQKKPTMETLQKFGEAMAPTATDYLSKKFGLEDLIREKEQELLEKRPGAVTVGNIIELGAELVPPATGYLKLIEDSSSKLYKVIRDGQAGKKVDPKDVEEVLELLSDKGVSRRDFLSIVGGTSIYALAKHIGIVDAVKISQKIKPVRMLSKSTTKMPEWFPSMIEKVLDDTGNSIFKQIDEDAVLITNKEMPGIEITKYDNGRLEVLGENNYGAKYYIEYDPAKYLDDGNYFPGDFSATDTRFYSLGPDDYTKENEIVDQVDDIFGGTDKMREYATGQKKKKLTSGEKEAIEAELRAESFTDEID
jgi:hypothetical protein